MHGNSRQTAATVRDALDAVLDDLLGGRSSGSVATGSMATGSMAVGAAQRVGQALFGVVDLLDEQSAVRRALTDPSALPQDKAALAHRLLDGKVPTGVVEVIQTAARGRWSRSRDVADTVEELAVGAVVADAESVGEADRVEDELFRFERIVAGDRALAAALADGTAGAPRRTSLVDALVEGRVAEPTRLLLHRAVVAPRGRSVGDALQAYGRAAAARRQLVVAEVTVAAPLAAEHRDRLATALTRLYRKPVHLNVDVDPTVLGGMRVAVGDEVIDGSTARRLDDVRRRLTG
ncbi:MAG: F0F1 ATP synthase subunit delta [Angustibacter sp.]